MKRKYLYRFYVKFIQDIKCQILAEVRAVASLEDAKGYQHLAGGHGGGWEQLSPIPPRGSGVRDPRILLYIFNTKSCILMHSLAPKMDNISVFISVRTHPRALGERKTVGRGCRMRPERPIIEAEGRDRGGVLREGATSPTS